MVNPVIFDQSRWQGILSTIKEGLQFLDSIILFDTDNVHLTFLGFDIAVLVFTLVWNSASLWSFEPEYFDSGGDDSNEFFDFDDEPLDYDPDVSNDLEFQALKENLEKEAAEIGFTDDDVPY